MPKTKDGGFLLDDRELEPYKVQKKEADSEDTDTEVQTEGK